MFFFFCEKEIKVIFLYTKLNKIIFICMVLKIYEWILN